MLRTLSLLLVMVLPVNAQAGLLDLLPLRTLERKMLYPLSAREVDPASLGLRNAQAHTLDRSGRKLVLWTLKADAASAPTLLYFHGNAGNLAMRASRFAAMQSEGFHVIAMSYPGSSGSGGTPSEATILADARAVFDQIPDLIAGARQTRVILYGESLGSAVAIGLLAELNAEDRPAGTILETPFTSIPAMAQNITEIPLNLIERIRDTWDSAARTDALTTPLLVIHGSADEVTPQYMGREIFSRAATKDKDFVNVRGASHNGTWRADTMPRIWRFIRSYGR